MKSVKMKKVLLALLSGIFSWLIFSLVSVFLQNGVTFGKTLTQLSSIIPAVFIFIVNLVGAFAKHKKKGH